MRIEKVEAIWLSCPIPEAKRHTSDYGTLTTFDMTLVVITDSDGNQGFGESKAAVASAGSCASILSCIQSELTPLLVGQPSNQISKLWEIMYSGSRAHYALERGRVFPVLGRRGLLISAMSGVDMALWDLLGKRLGVPVLQLLGGSCRNKMPAYASGGWATVDQIGAQVAGYVNQGFSGVKMRVGVIDGSVRNSVARVAAAREALGPDIKLMADAHGTWSIPEAKQFAKACESFDLYWLEEPLGPDNKKGTSELRSFTTIPIAAGESEYTRFDVRDLIDLHAIDVVQPDLAIAGGITEGQRIAHLANAYQLELAPHCWGSPLSFSAGVSLAFSSPNGRLIEYSLGENPLMDHLSTGKWTHDKGWIKPPEGPGLGVDIDWDFVERFRVDS